MASVPDHAEIYRKLHADRSRQEDQEIRAGDAQAVVAFYDEQIDRQRIARATANRYYDSALPPTHHECFSKLAGS